MRARRSAPAMLAAAALALAACARATYVAPDASSDDVDAAQAIDARELDAPPDAPGSQCSQQPCSILPQCGCDSPAAPVCDLDFQNPNDGATRCRADNFHGTETTTCTMTTTCAAEHVCVGRCRRYCNTDNDCAGDGALCIIHLTVGNPPMNIPGVTTCTTSCTPSQPANATCPAGWGCHIYRESGGAMRYLTDCDAPPASGGTAGAACASNGDCAPGLDCVTVNGGANQCRPTCLCLGGNCATGSCPAGTGSCGDYTTPVIIGGSRYGACL